MAGCKLAVLLFGLALASALPKPAAKADVETNQPSWWPEWLPPPSVQPDSIPWPPTHPEVIPWPPVFPEDAPSWWPESHPWPPTEHPESIPWPPTHPEAIPWPPVFPEDVPSWWPESLPWPPTEHPEWIPWPPQHPEWIPLPPQHPEWIPWPPQHPEWIPWPPQVPEINLPYNPARDNQFHLFTRANPGQSQPLVQGNGNILTSSNYDASRRTIVLLHDLNGSAVSAPNAILVPSLLAAADVNVIVVDWSAGASSGTALSSLYSVLSGNFVSRFIEWLSDVSNSDLESFHLIGVGLGGHNAGYIGARLRGNVGYVTALDPSGPAVTRYLPPLSLNVGRYSEVVHTDAGKSGHVAPLGHVDFYPNGGENMPGCAGNSECNRLRAVYYFSESIQTGGFTGVECASFRDALNGSCDGEGLLKMGGLTPKTGQRGVFFLETNALPPFSRG